jgi:diphosphomevalonate decarboxylase
MKYTASWRSPSNIALIKYWGKHSLQLPRNPSLSFTLSVCHTSMTMSVETDASIAGLLVKYEGQPKPTFEPKIKSFLALLESRFPWIGKAAIEIDSQNSFPHGAGIASSASSMSALALCLLDIDDQITGAIADRDETWWQNASEIARMGSGSACRSVFPVAALWGQTHLVRDSNDLFAIPYEHELAPVFTDYCDAILIVSGNEKAVSSSAGHRMMDELSFAEKRYQEAHHHLERLLGCLKRENEIDQFIAIVESEALQLHALMMCGRDPYILMEPGTLSVIREVWKFRKETGIPVCFTLDAGPNVHLLYPSAYSSEILAWIKNALSRYCSEGKYILDRVGAGPQKLL